MSKFLGIPRIDRLLDGSDETVNRHGNQVRQLLLVEGDLYLTLCADPAAYDTEISALYSCYGRSPAYVAVSDDLVTVGYQDRSQLFIDPARAPEAAGQETDDP